MALKLQGNIQAPTSNLQRSTKSQAPRTAFFRAHERQVLLVELISISFSFYGGENQVQFFGFSV